MTGKNRPDSKPTGSAPIESLRLRRFQNHDTLLVRLDPRVTTIVGANDSGKTAVIRAFNLLAFNRPRGSRFVKHGSKQCKVSLTVDGKTIVRVRGKKTNLYRLDGKVYKAFGVNGVPPAAADLLNLSPASVQNQHDLHYWFSDTPGQVSKNLNKIVNLDLIDATLGRAASLVRSSAEQTATAEAVLAQATATKAKLAWVGRCEVDFARFERAERRYRLISHKTARLATIVVGLAKSRRERDRASKAMLDGKKCLSAGGRAGEVAGRAETLARLLSELQKVESVSADVPDVSGLVSVRAKGDLVAANRAELEGTLRDLSAAADAERTLTKELKRWQKKLAAAQPAVCPTCGKSLTAP